MHIAIKICGITNAADARTAVNAGADSIGLNFYPKSPRYLADATEIERIRLELPAHVQSVGVFVNETWAQACAIATQHRINIIQMHGDAHEPVSRFPFGRIDAFRVGDERDLKAIQDFLAKAADVNQLPSGIIVDANVPGQYGGTGHKPPWSLLADFRPGVKWLLAGGLVPENVAEAIRLVRPDGVDVASGVESAPGRKDADKLRRFIDNARNAASKLTR